MAVSLTSYSPQFVWSALTVALPLFCLLPNTARGSKDRQPNFLFLQADDLNFMDNWAEAPPGAFSKPERWNANVRLPNMDHLRDRSVVFSRAYTASTKCSPSRLATLTGRSVSRAVRPRVDAVGDCFAETARRPLVDNFDSKVSGADFEENLPQALRAAGYFTGHAGKWHLGRDDGTKFENYTEAKRQVHLAGFDWVGGLYEHNFEKYDEKPYSAPWGNWSHNLEWVTAEARKFISEANSDGRPFFLHYAATTPHGPDVYQAMEQFSPLETPEGTLSEMPESRMPSRESILERTRAVLTEEQLAAAGKGEKHCVWPGMEEGGHGCWLIDPGLAASYAAGSIWTDEAFGAVVSHLADLGILDNTVVVAFSDHGKPGKGTLTEGGVRTWLTIRYPELFTPGTRDDRMVTLQDLMPTFLDLAGVEPRYLLDGRSLVPLADPPQAQVSINSVPRPLNTIENTGEPQNEERMLFLEVFANRALVTRNFKYLDRPPRVKKKPRCHITAPPVRELYDLRWDGLESFNLTGVPEYEYLVQEFAARMDCVEKVLGLDTSMEDARGKSYQHCLDMKLSFTDTSAEDNGIDWGGPVLPAGCEKEKTLQACYFGD